MKPKLALTAILLGIVGSAYAATELEGTAQRRRTVKVLSFNVWTGSAAAIARDLRISGADIACLQEVSVREAEDTAASLGSDWHAVTAASGSEYAILSRFPVLQHLGETRLPRGGVAALVEVEGGLRAHVFCHHGVPYPYGPYLLGIDRLSVDEVIRKENETRGSQMAELLSLARPYMNSPFPVFLVGDFNAPSHLDYNPPVAWPVSKSIHNAGFADSYADLHPGNPKKYACQFNQDDPGITWAKIASEEPYNCFDRIDFIYYTPGKAKPVASDTLDLESSDHRALVTTFEIGN